MTDIKISEHERDPDNQRKRIYSEIARYAVMRWGREEAGERLAFYMETLFGGPVSPDALGIDELIWLKNSLRETVPVAKRVILEDFF